MSQQQTGKTTMCATPRPTSDDSNHSTVQLEHSPDCGVPGAVALSVLYVYLIVSLRMLPFLMSLHQCDKDKLLFIYCIWQLT